MLTGATMPSNFQVPYIITVEQVGSKQRSWLVCISWTLWTLGSCCLAFTAYVTRHWTTLGLVTTLPIAAFFAYKSYLKPSPRYLMAQGRCEEATEVIQTIAKINGRKVPKGLLSRLKAITENEKNEGEVDSNISVFTFFKYPQLRKKLFIVTLNWTAIAIAYFGLTLNATNLGSNDFLNFFLLSSVELPAFPLALLLMEKLGRRKRYGFCRHHCFNDRKIWLCRFVHGYLSTSCRIVSTPIRALGMGIGSVVSSLAVICMPYVCYLGIYNKAIPFLIIGAMCVVAGLTAPLVPETLHKQLPQTIKGSEEFGTGRGCFPCCASAERKDDDPENPEGA
ncbi:organic cation transporter 1 [Caerostris extrusa]|uniref:Organic cation transporter 1 n=1 Tax=Caerostris extrusa TaxID=172846 RepID=A0AAV4XMV1_CAEEX|nr:organic cation transporter 1 [Caerostris extrusa]